MFIIYIYIYIFTLIIHPKRMDEQEKHEGSWTKDDDIKIALN